MSLVLQYGNPVTFHQAIYQNYFVQRPEVPVEVLGRLLPDVDTQAVAASAPVPGPEGDAVPVPGSEMDLEMSRRLANQKEHSLAMAGGEPSPPPPPPPSMAPPSDSVAASEGADDTVFPIATPISLAAGHTESVPILDVSVPAQRLSLATFGATHPISALRVRNRTDQSMPAGVLTLYDTQGAALYAGDARLGGLPAGETRLLLFAEDLRTTLAWDSKPETTIATFKAAHGKLDLTQRDRTDTIVTITAPKNEPRHLLVELPKDQGAIVPPDATQPTEATQTDWRFAVDVKPGQASTLKLSAETHFSQDITLTPDATPIAAEVTNLQGLPADARAALAKIDVLKSHAQDCADTYDQLTQQRQAIEQDETRLRANLAVLQPQDALRTQLLDQLATDESKLGTFVDNIRDAQAAVLAARQALQSAIAGFNF